MHPSLSAKEEGGGVEPLTTFSKTGDLTGSQFFEGGVGAGKEDCEIFQGGLQLLKHKLNSETFIFKKKFINKNVFLYQN